MAISKQQLAHEFVSVINSYYPKSAQMLNSCYVKVLECYLERLGKRLYYIGIYHSNELAAEIRSQHKFFKEIAENMGLVEVVYLNANRLIRDPKSKLKQENPRLWLELFWVATQGK